MFVDAETAVDAEEIAERISGTRVWGRHEFKDSHAGEVFNEVFFLNFLNSKSGT